MDAPAEVRIVLLGITGSGKSSAGNVILGEKKFDVFSDPNSVTIDCQTEEGNINGWKFRVTDTPGIFDPEMSEEDPCRKKYSIISCLTECAPGPHAFILVLRVGRYTKEEEESVRMILQYFEEEVLKYTVVLFTHGDELDKNQTIKEFVEKNKDLKKLSDKLEGRVHVIDSQHWNKKDFMEELKKMMIEKSEAGESQAIQTLKELSNRIFEPRSSTFYQETGQGSGRPTSSHGNPDEREYRSNSFQIKQLLTTIHNMMKENEGRCYTNESLQRIAKGIQDEVNEIIKERKRMIEPLKEDSYTTESQKLLEMEATEDEVDKTKERNTEIWKEARKRIRNKILQSKAAGATVGSLLGALLGVPVGAAVPFVALAGLFTVAVKSILGSRSKEPEVNTGNITAVGAVEGVAGTAGAAVGVAVGATGAAAAVGATGAAAAVGTAEAAAIGTVLGTSVAKTAAAGAAIGAGAAAGVGLAVTGGVYAIAGAVRGGMAGAKAGETCVDINHAAKEAAKAAGQAGLSTLKDVWDATQKLARSKESPYKKLQ